MQAALQEVTEAIEEATSNSGRKRRSLTYSINHGDDAVTVDPYCEVNEADALTGDPAEVLLTMVDDLSAKMSNLTTDQISCFSQLLSNFATFIANGTFVIDSSLLDNITAAVEDASSVAGDQIQSLQSLISSLQAQKENATAELALLDSQLVSTGKKIQYLFSLHCVL